MEDFDELLTEAHNRNIKIVMDLVVNHTSDEHAWFVESRSSKMNPKRDYYIWRPANNGKEPNDWKSAFSGSAWKYDEHTDEYFLHLFSKKQPDLNWENPNLRQDVYEMMRYWLDKGIDGFRMDVINFISKDKDLTVFMNGPRIHEFLREMNQEVLSKYDIMTVGEMPGVSTTEAKLYTGEDRHELNMVFQFEHMDLDSGVGGKWDLKPWTLRDLKSTMSKWQKALHGIGWNSLYLNNHDQPRLVSRFGNDSEYRVQSAKMLATFLHMMQGTPFIYQGEEIGMTNVRFDTIDEYQDLEILNMWQEKVVDEGQVPEKILHAIHVKGRDNARTPMQWNSSENAGFTSGTPWLKVNPNFKEINVEAALDDRNSVFYYYQKLIQLRKELPIIVHGDYELLHEEDDEIYAYVRNYHGEKLLVVLNFFANDATFKLPNHIRYHEVELIISNYETQERNVKEIHLRPYEAVVYLLK